MSGNGVPSPRHQCRPSQGDECGRCLRYGASSEVSDRPYGPWHVAYKHPRLHITPCLGRRAPSRAIVPPTSGYARASRFYLLLLAGVSTREPAPIAPKNLSCRERSRKPAISGALFRVSRWKMPTDMELIHYFSSRRHESLTDRKVHGKSADKKPPCSTPTVAETVAHLVRLAVHLTQVFRSQSRPVPVRSQPRCL